MLDEVSFFLTKKIHKKERRKIFFIGRRTRRDKTRCFESMEKRQWSETERATEVVGESAQIRIRREGNAVSSPCSLAPYPIYGLNTMVEE